MLIAPTIGVAAQNAMSSAFPEKSYAYFGKARVVAKQGKQVKFAELLEYHCRNSCSTSDLLVVNGDVLLTNGMQAGRVYAWFVGGGRYLRGWLPAENIKQLPSNSHPSLDSWKGIWRVGHSREIVIKGDPATGDLTIVAHAEWHGGMLESGEQVVHTGDIQGHASPDDNRLVVRDEDCVLELELVGKYLGAQDNMHCGGMNVSFSDAYTREADAGSDLK